MDTNRRFFAVGIFVLSGIVGFGSMIAWLSTHRIGYAVYEVQFSEPVSGIASGTPVRYNGIDVGSVTNIDFDRNDPRRVIALLELRPDLPIRTDSLALVDNQGLTGESYIEIDGGSGAAPLLKRESGSRYPVIPSGHSSFYRIKTEAPEVLHSFRKMADNASDLLNEQNQKKVAEILKNVSAASDRLDQVLLSTDQAAKAIADLAKKLGTMSDKIADTAMESKDQIRQSAAQINQAFADADAAAKRLDKLSMDVDHVVTSSEAQFTDGIGQLNQLFGQTRSLVQKIGRLTDDVQRQPTELLFGDRRQGYMPK